MNCIQLLAHLIIEDIVSGVQYLPLVFHRLLPSLYKENFLGASEELVETKKSRFKIIAAQTRTISGTQTKKATRNDNAYFYKQ